MHSEIEQSPFIFTAETSKVIVSAEPYYLPEESQPLHDFYVWAYKITIENLGVEPLTLLSRTWYITDALGLTQEVQGEGVLGNQPRILSGESYEYSSYASLRTASGMMTGHYTMTDDFNTLSEIAVPAFSLDSPQQLKFPN